MPPLTVEVYLYDYGITTFIVVTVSNERRERREVREAINCAFRLFQTLDWINSGASPR